MKPYYLCWIWPCPSTISQLSECRKCPTRVLPRQCIALKYEWGFLGIYIAAMIWYTKHIVGWRIFLSVLMIRRLLCGAPNCLGKSFLPFIDWAASLGIGLIYSSDHVRVGLSSELCHLHHEQFHNPCFLHFSTAIRSEREFPGGYSSHTILLSKFESALKCHQVDEAWEPFSDFKSLHGFPDNFLVSRLITQLSYSSDAVWLHKIF